MIAFDNGLPDWRSNILPEYKQGRPEKKPELAAWVEDVRSAFDRSGILTLCHSEADDAIYTAAVWYIQKFEKPVVIVSSDTDMFGMVTGDEIRLMWFGRSFSDWEGVKGRDIYNSEMTLEKFGVAAWQLPHYKALAGDKSDNVPGVPGIGKKSAVELLALYMTIDGILEEIDMVPEKWGRKIREHEAKLLLYKEVLTPRYTPIIANYIQSNFDKLAGWNEPEMSKVATEVLKKWSTTMSATWK